MPDPTSVSIQGAQKIAMKIIRDTSIQGRVTAEHQLNDQLTRSGGLNVSYERAWGASASIEVTFVRHGAGKKKRGETVFEHHVVINVRWGSTTHSPLSARVAVALQAQVTDLACVLEEALRREEIVDVLV
jgi:hypothetical protein